VIDAPDAVLQEAEEALDGLGVSIPIDVDAILVANTAMALEVLAEPLAIADPFVREDHRGR
jgi:hypothetical protein